MKVFKKIILMLFVNVVILPRPISTAISARNSQDIVGSKIVTRKGSDFQIFTTNKQGIAEDTDNDYRFLIIGGTHGDEIETSDFVKWLYRRTASGQGRFSHIEGKVTFDFIPVLNVDNYGKSRYNSNAVNLNRNYSVNWGKSRERFGSEPFSEPETQLIKALYDKFSYTAAVDVHGYIDWIVAPSLPHKMASHSNYDNTRDYTKWVGELKRNIYKLPGDAYQVHTDMNLNDGGAFEDWSFWERDTPAFCLEMVDPVTESNRIANYLKYENYLYKMFKTSIRLKNEQTNRQKSESLAGTFAWGR